MGTDIQQFILSHFPHVPTAGQREACDRLAEFLFDPDPYSAFMLTGYAGTGKTSLVSALIQSAPALRIHTMLMAPTGRAAKVLSNYSGHKAYTIHKKIYQTITDSSGMIRTARALNKHSYTLFIVDEASMIGQESQEYGAWGRRSLLEDLIDYVTEGNHCRLLLIGDTAQLPPVGSPESPALDPEYLQTISPLKIFHSELTEVVRQQNLSGILHNATLVRQQIAEMDDYSEPELPLFDLEGFDDVVRLPGAELEDTLQRHYSDGEVDNVVFICRSNKRANLFNQEIRNRILFRDDRLCSGDYLMVVKNNYYWLDTDSEIGFIANGDIVEVLSVRNHQELYGFHFADVSLRFVDYPDAPEIDCKVLLETLVSESPALTGEESQQLFNEVMADYADIPDKSARLREVKRNPYFNALQVKYAYALTCHKTQGGQWPTVFVDQGYLTDDMLNKDYLRWLYTALTRATEQVYLLNFEEKFFE